MTRMRLAISGSAMLVAALLTATGCGRYGPPLRSTPGQNPASVPAASPDPAVLDPAGDPAAAGPDFKINLPDSPDTADDADGDDDPE